MIKMRIKKKELDKLKGRFLAVGVNHALISNRLFFYYGILEEVTNKEIKLKLKNGFKIISIDEIRDAHRTSRR